MPLLGNPDRRFPNDHGRMAHKDMFALSSICLVALILRCAVGWEREYIVAPDETYNYLEQAFRLAFGYGTHIWAYDIGFRSYLFPGILSLIMRAAGSIVNRPGFYVGAVTLFMSCLSLSVVVASYVWARITNGFLGAVVAGMIAAVWYELIYFAPHALSEVFATNFLVMACLVYSVNPAGDSRFQDICLAACLAVAVFVRVQLTPAAGVLLLWMLWQRGPRGSLLVLASFLGTFTALGFSDLITYRYPFQSIILNVLINTVGGISNGYGTSSIYRYLDLELHYNGGVAILIFLGCIIAGLRMPLLLLEPISIVVPHSLLAHKEYRFIYPAIPFMVALAAIATTDLVKLISPERPSFARPMVAALAVAVWSGGSLAQAAEGPFRREWFRASGEIAAAQWISELHGVCGVGSYLIHASALAGLVRFHHDVSVLTILVPEHFRAAAPGFNVLIATDDRLPADPDFRLEKCWANGFNEASYNVRMPEVCVLRRAGTCQPGAVSDPDPDSPLPRLRQPWHDIIERMVMRAGHDQTSIELRGQVVWPERSNPKP